MTTMCYTPAGMKPNLDHLSAALVFILLAVSLPAHSDSETGFEDFLMEKLVIFSLYNACKPMNIAVTGLDSDAEEISLRKEDIENIVESRLRSAGLFLDQDEGEIFETALLFIRVSVAGAAFVVSLDFAKPLWDETLEMRSRAGSWDSTNVGTHGRDADYILSAVRIQMERFIVEYLRVNDEAC